MSILPCLGGLCPSERRGFQVFAPEPKSDERLRGKYAPEDLKAYLVHLSIFQAATHSAFSESITERVKRFPKPISPCIDLEKLSPWARVLFGSWESRCAMIIGFTLGSSSGFVSGCISMPALFWVSSILSGSGNACSSYWGLVDTVKRDIEQNIHLQIEKIFQEMSCYLVREYIQSPKESQHSQELKGIAENILENAEQLHEGIARYVSEEGTLSVLLEACSYVAHGTEPTHEALRNEAATYDSPSLQKFEALLARTEQLERLVQQLMDEREIAV